MDANLNDELLVDASIVAIKTLVFVLADAKLDAIVNDELLVAIINVYKLLANGSDASLKYFCHKYHASG